MKWSENYFKAAVINILQEVRVKTCNEWKDRKSQQRYRRYKKKQNRNDRTKIYDKQNLEITE